ncbi:hypothetical protein LCGC14_0415600 [marine sediment metagenome]|uniref:Terminase n=1 Tax=marine sediment metagenome TaxID=412755 RepID=A0A0F9SYD0_9ZZZZ
MQQKSELSQLRPTLSEPFPDVPKIWTDPVTGLKVPKCLDENLEWRINLIKRAEKDPILQNDLMAACSASILFWFNAFVWTFRQFDVDPITNSPVPAKMPNMPFITWEVQDGSILNIEDAINSGYDLGFKKSRDMGASWIDLGTFHHQWLFYPDTMLLELSRVEDYVDLRGNMKALFQKHDYINEWLPDWMVPPGCRPGEKHRKKMHMKNALNKSVIDGEATTANAASGDRRKAVLLDEFAKVDNGQAIRSATADVTPCRIVNSTPCGAGTEYSRWLASGQIKVIRLPWYEHPEKGVGRRVIQNDITGEYSITSPWYENEQKRRSPKEMAQEIDMNDIESGSTVFDVRIVENHKALFARPPKIKMKVAFDRMIPNAQIPEIIRSRRLSKIKTHRTVGGPLLLWVNLINGRLDQTKHYTIGIDISKGQGASNTVFSILCNETGEKVGEWADANTPPHEAARIAVAIALWVGGACPKRIPFVIWEMNGDPGLNFSREIVTNLRYPYYYRHVDEKTVVAKKTRKPGWHSNSSTKPLLLGQYNTILSQGGYINHSEIALTEATYYINYKDGGMGPAALYEESL